MNSRCACATAAFILALAVLSACGGGSGGGEPKSAAGKVQQVSDRFNEAFSSGDYGTACELLHSRRRGDLEYEQSKSCEDILESAAQTDSELVKALGDAKTTAVSVHGNTATVDMEGGALGPGRQAILERDGKEWRVTEAAAGL